MPIASNLISILSFVNREMSCCAPLARLSVPLFACSFVF
jgi:hypothetical protein